MADALKSRVVGSAKDVFHREYAQENAMGNMLTDAIRDRARKKNKSVQFALLNSGGTRNDLSAGTLKFGDVYKVQPFDNYLAIVDLKGFLLRSLLEISYSGAHGISPSSGFKIKRLNVAADAKGVWDRDLNGDGKMELWERNLIVDVRTEKGEELNADTIYSLATSDFLVNGAEAQKFVYDQVPATQIHRYTEYLLRDALVDYIKQHPGIDPKNYYNPNDLRIESVNP